MRASRRRTASALPPRPACLQRPRALALAGLGALPDRRRASPRPAAPAGNDSLLSIVQMPKGVPVATVAIGNAANAGLLAVRMLGVGRPALLDAMASYMREQEQEVLGKAAKLEAQGWDVYEYVPPH